MSGTGIRLAAAVLSCYALSTAIRSGALLSCICNLHCEIKYETSLSPVPALRNQIQQNLFHSPQSTVHNPQSKEGPETNRVARTGHLLPKLFTPELSKFFEDLWTAKGVKILKHVPPPSPLPPPNNFMKRAKSSENEDGEC
eukprot:3178942-Rhodomonas_salina.1